MYNNNQDYTNPITEVTQLYSINVDDIYVPGNITQLQNILRRTDKNISIGGGRFSMGGQIAHTGSLHIDMRGLNRIIDFDAKNKTIKVQTGITWNDIQSVIDGQGLSIKIMQTYANFTVGGSLSVNCHGRYVGLGPLILSVLSISIVLSNGELVQASPDENSDIFYASIGGYGALGIIVEAKLSLAENTKIERIEKKMPLSEYPAFFKRKVRNDKANVFHNADMIPPKFNKTRAVSWIETDKPVNTKPKKERHFYFLEKYMLWAITETVMGHFRREYIYEPLIYLRPKITYRNDEANYDVAELEPVSRSKSTYVLQEYFVPVENILEFTEPLTEILNRFKVQVVNISIRHSHPDSGSYLSWASEEVFAFVLYYKQGVSNADRERVAVWTRELIDAVISCGGRYYLPYQPHARYQQFHQAYPNAEKLFKLKAKLDPKYQFRHCLWEKYYLPDDDLPLLSSKELLNKELPNKDKTDSEFLNVYGNINSRDGFYRFLQNIYRLYPEHKFHQLIIDACEKFDTDEEIYQHISQNLPEIKTILSEIMFALPSLKKQKKVIAEQTLDILDKKQSHNGYLEIGSTGRYVKSLKKLLGVQGQIFLSNDATPDNSPPEMAERGGIGKVGSFFPLNDYAPISSRQIKDESLDLVTCYIGLHHCPNDKLDDYIQSISRILRPGGHFILRDHNAGSDDMKIFCSLVHTIFNAGLNTSWEENQTELRLFNSVEYWVKTVSNHNFIDSGKRLLQSHDPSLNTLLCFKKA
jgi:FAD/FMN-containing dehydrogenase